MTYVLGIDLGTTNSCMAVLEAGEPIVLENSEGGRTTPSVVAMTNSNQRLVGQVARRQAVTNPGNTVFSIKRFIGRKFDDAEVQRSRELAPYSVAPGPNGDAYVRLGNTDYAAAQISAMILAKLKADAELRLGEEVRQAVITVPAYFDDAMRQATKDAGRIAGLDVLRIINEPTAAALAYGMGRNKDEVVAVYDLGGGTFDISILQLGEGIFEVKSTNGDTHLGGDDLDTVIVEWLLKGFEAEHGIDLKEDKAALHRLKDAAEKAKIELTSLLQTEIHLPFIASGADGPLHLAATLTRAKLEGLVSHLIESTAEPCRRAMIDAEVMPAEIDAVLLVGGQTRMPAVQAAVRAIFGKEPKRGVNPDEVVAVGAAIQAGALSGEVSDVLLLDVTPLTLGVETQGGMVAPVIPRNTSVPTTRCEVFTTAVDNQDSVEVHVTQGERPTAGENKSLARFHLDGIPPAPRGVPQIEVSFSLDANGILSASARDRTTNRAQHITVSPSSGLTAADIERMVQQAEQYAETDRERQWEIVLRNEADALLYQAERAGNEAPDRINRGDLDQLGYAAAALEEALSSNDMAQVRERLAPLRLALDALRGNGAMIPFDDSARRLAG